MTSKEYESKPMTAEAGDEHMMYLVLQELKYLDIPNTIHTVGV